MAEYFHSAQRPDEPDVVRSEPPAKERNRLPPLMVEDHVGGIDHGQSTDLHGRRIDQTRAASSAASASAATAAHVTRRGVEADLHRHRVAAVGGETPVVGGEADPVVRHLGVGEVAPVLGDRRRAANPEGDVEHPHPTQGPAGLGHLGGELVEHHVEQAPAAPMVATAVSKVEAFAVGELEPALAEVEPHHLGAGSQLGNPVRHAVGQQSDPARTSGSERPRCSRPSRRADRGRR